ncbi:hypothetical protein AaE_014124, partial [Aphanomyces astaci]
MFERELEEPKKDREREVEELQCDFEERKMDRQREVEERQKDHELKRTELEAEEFAATFWEKHDEKPLRDIVNVDETAVYYDMPPRRTWCEIGEDAKVDSTEKHSDRLTAVLGACADGTKLPILFIVRGQPGGPIETDEVPTYPDGNVYAVQETAWMDESVWVYHLKELLKYELVGPSVLL